MALSENLYIHYPAHFRRYFYVATKIINHNKNRQLPRAKKHKIHPANARRTVDFPE
ncbi:hypothetical protein ACEPUD_00825 [Burkholderia ubonensis]|uniref:hypothetical protein n=1 Tax=Burkholderia ubonensis TaxID=101571 RepID=UPI000A697EB2|nr:hypothetical protein [Burkholderia ubonensis]